MAQRRVLLPALFSLASGALYVALYSRAPEFQALWIINIAAMNSTSCYAVGNLTAPWRKGDDDRRRWRANGVLLSVGALIMGPAVFGWYAFSRGQMPIFYPVIAYGTAPLSVGLFFTIADGLAFGTRRAKSIQTRMILMGALCVGLSSLLPYWVRFEHNTGFTFLLYAAIALVIIVGFSGVIAERIIAPLKRTASAMNEVTAGNLNVALDDSGRDELATVARAFNAMTHGLREREFLERAFGRYVAPSVLAALKESHALEMKPERRDASVLFADIRGFTSFSEANSPEDVLRILNVYLERVVEIVAQHQGYLNKFIGDAVMVVFNAPLDQADHAQRVLSCAKAMQRAVAEMNAAGEFGPGRRVEIGIGINSGPLVAGNVGGASRAEYSVIGDTVNTASRLCSNAKSGEVLVGAATAQACGKSGLEAVAPLTVKGKAQPLEVYRLAA